MSGHGHHGHHGHDHGHGVVEVSSSRLMGATVVNVGGAQEVPGITGLAHMFEHMAFKGTPNIGTPDFEGNQGYRREAPLVQAALNDLSAHLYAHTNIDPDDRAEATRLLARARQALEQTRAQFS